MNKEDYLALDLKPNEVEMVIYHGGCTDGFASAFIAHNYFEINHPERKIDFYAASFYQPPPVKEATNKCVLMCDFSYKFDDLVKLIQVCKKFLILDHHIGAQDDLKDIPSNQKIFCLEHCGAYLTYRYFNLDQSQIPMMITYIEDYDLWLKKQPKTEEFSSYVNCMEFKFSCFKKLLDKDFIEKEVFVQGSIILKRNNALIKKWIKHANVVFLLIDGQYYFVSHLNSSHLKSELGAKLVSKFSQCNFVAIYSNNDENNTTVFSLRSNDKATDVNIMAQKFKGRGHRNSSGFSTTTICNIIPSHVIDATKSTYEILSNTRLDFFLMRNQKINIATLNSSLFKKHLGRYLLQTRYSLEEDGKIVQEAVHLLSKYFPTLTSVTMAIIWSHNGSSLDYNIHFCSELKSHDKVKKFVKQHIMNSIITLKCDNMLCELHETEDFFTIICKQKILQQQKKMAMQLCHVRELQLKFWNEAQFVKVPRNILQILVYFFNNNFSLQSTLNSLRIFDLDERNKQIVSLSVIFILANFLHACFYQTRGIFSILISMKKKTLANLPGCISKDLLDGYDNLFEQISKSKLNLTFNLLEQALDIESVIDLYRHYFNFNQTVLLFDPKSDDKLIWFERVFFTFYPTSNKPRSILKPFIKDLMFLKTFPFNLLNIFYLAALISSESNSQAIIDILDDVEYYKVLVFFSFLGSLVFVFVFLMFVKYPSQVPKGQLMKMFQENAWNQFEQLDHLKVVIYKFYTYKWNTSLIFLRDCKECNRETAQFFFLQVMNNMNDYFIQPKCQKDFIFYLKQLDAKNHNKKSEFEWTGIFLLAKCFNQGFQLNMSWFDIFEELFLLPVSKCNNFKLFGCWFEYFFKLATLENYPTIRKNYIFLCVGYQPMPLETFLVTKFATCDFTTNEFTTNDAKNLFFWIYDSNLFNNDNNDSNCENATKQIIIRTEQKNENDFVFTHNDGVAGVENLLSILSRFIPKDMNILMDCILYYYHCKKCNLDLLTSWYILEQSSLWYDQHSLITFCLPNSKKNSNNQKWNQHVNQIVCDLKSWYKKYSFLEKDNFWNRFGYYMQMQKAFERAQLDQEKTCQDIKIIQDLKIKRKMERKENKKYKKQKCLEIANLAKQIIFKSEQILSNVQIIELRARKSYCLVLANFAQKSAYNALLYSRMALTCSKTARKYKTTIKKCNFGTKNDTKVKSKMINSKNNANAKINTTAQNKASIKSKKELLVACVVKARNAAESAERYAHHAQLANEKSHDFVAMITKDKQRQESISELNFQIIMESHVLFLCRIILNTCLDFFEGNLDMSHIKLDTREKYSKFHQSVIQFSLSIQFIDCPKNTCAIFDSDFGQTLTQNFEYSNSILRIVSEYSEEPYNDFLMRNKFHLLKFFYIELDKIKKACADQELFSSFTNLWQKAGINKDTLHFFSLSVFCSQAVKRIYQHLNQLSKIVPKDDHCQMLKIGFQRTAIDSSICQTDAFRAWFYPSHNNIPIFVVFDHLHIQILTWCWLKTSYYSHINLCEFLNFGCTRKLKLPQNQNYYDNKCNNNNNNNNKNNKFDFFNHKKAVNFCEKTKAMINNEHVESLIELQVCQDALLEFRIDISFLFFLRIIFDEIDLYALDNEGYFVTLLTCLCELNPEAHATIISNEIAHSDFGKKSLYCCVIISSYCLFTHNPSYNLIANENDIVSLMRSTICVLEQQLKILIQNESFKNIVALLCCLSKLIQRLDFMLKSLSGMPKQCRLAFLNLWHRHSTVVTPQCYQLWATKNKIPTCLRHLDRTIIRPKVQLWIASGCKDNILKFLQ